MSKFFDFVDKYKFHIKIILASICFFLFLFCALFIIGQVLVDPRFFKFAISFDSFFESVLFSIFCLITFLFAVVTIKIFINQSLKSIILTSIATVITVAVIVIYIKYKGFLIKYNFFIYTTNFMFPCANFFYIASFVLLPILALAIILLGVTEIIKFQKPLHKTKQEQIDELKQQVQDLQDQINKHD